MAVSSLNGGIALYERQSENAMLVELIDKFVSKLQKCIDNNDTPKQPQLQLNSLCMNTLKEAAHLGNPNDGAQIAEQFFFASLSKASV